MVLRALVFCLCLTGCVPAHRDAVASFDTWTGFTRIITPEHEIFRDSKGIMTVRAAMISKAGQDQYGVLINVRRRVPNAPRVVQVQSGNTTLRYHRIDRIWSHCIDGCQRAEVGFVVMNQDSFAIAARTGLPLRVFGRRGRYAGVVPAHLFRTVLDHKARFKNVP